jgi:hypothetical protein
MTSVPGTTVLHWVATPTAANVRAVYMRFGKGNYLLGMERELVPLGTEFIMHGAGEGWLRRIKGEPVQRVPRQPGNHSRCALISVTPTNRNGRCLMINLLILGH